MALERLKQDYDFDYESVGISEVDEFANLSYEAIHDNKGNVEDVSDDEKRAFLDSLNIPINTDKMEKKNLKGKRLSAMYKAAKNTNNYGDISKINPDNLPDIDLFTYSFPCFTGDSLVLTDKGYKEIKDIKVGDKVLTHDNSYQKVLRTFNNGLKDTLIINGMSVDEIVTTNNHKFYVRKRYRKYNNNQKKYIRLFEEPKWVEAKNLTKDHYLGTPVNQESKIPDWDGLTFSWNTNIPSIGVRTKESNVIKPLLNNKNFWWLIGRYVADGWIRQQGGIVIAIGKNKIKEFEDKVEDTIKYTLVEERTTFKAHFAIKEIEEFVKPIGKGASNKRIPSFIIDLPTNLLKEFVAGYISGDGYKNNKYYKLSTTSKELVYELGQCISKAYKRPYAIYKTKRPKKTIIEGREVNQKDSYELVFKMENGKQDKAFYEDGFIWYPFTKSIKGKEEVVYDIEVENNHSFTVQNTIVHNCTDISSIGEQKGFSKGSGTRSSLLWDCEKIIDIKRPKFLLMENVKALVGKKNINGFNEWIEVLEKLGYNNYWQVLNAIDYGIPQNRERVFLVSILKEYDKGFKFPESFKLDKDIRDLLIKSPEENLYYPDYSIGSYMNYGGTFPRRSRFLTQSKMTNLNHISPTLTASGGNKCTSAAIYEPKGDNLTWSINNLEEKETRDKTTVDDIVDNYKVRRLAPIENFRLMGVSDDDFYKAEKVCSKTQLNKQAGNAIVVDVLYYIFKSLFNLQDN